MTPHLQLIGTLEGDIVGHMMLFEASFIYAMYIIFFEGVVYKRLSKNILMLCTLFTVLCQCAKCVTVITYLNYDIQISATIDKMLRVAFLTSFILYHIFIIINKNYKTYSQYIFPSVVLIGIASVALQYFHSAVFVVYFMLAIVFGVIAQIKFYADFRRGMVNLDENILSRSQLNIVLIVTMLAVVIGLAIGFMAGANPLARISPALMIYPSLVIQSVFIGQMDFMRKASKDHVAQPAAQMSVA